MTASNSYTLHGLTLRSQLPFPELPPAAPELRPDVTVQLGPTPRTLERVLKRGVCFEAGPREFLITRDGTARFHVSHGGEVMIETSPGADPAEVRRLFLSSPLAALLLMRGLVPLQASAVATPHGAVVFAAGTTLGKSTLAMEMNRRGFPFLSDDISVIARAADGRATVAPGFPLIKLWPDALLRLDIDPETLPKVRPALDKRVCHVAASFERSAQPLRRIYILQRGEALPGSQLIFSMTGAERAAALVNHLYSPGFMLGLDVHAAVMPQLGKLANEIPVVRAVQPGGRFVAGELADAIQADLAT